MVSLIAKIGGSVLTRIKNGPSFNKDVASRIVKELYMYQHGCILIHGTGYFGKPPAIKYNYLNTGIIKNNQKMIALKIKDQLREYNRQFIDVLLSADIPALPIDILHFYDIASGSIILNGLQIILKELIMYNIMPVFYGDIIPIPDGDFKVLSSDEITLILTRLFHPDTVILISNVDGVFLKGGDNYYDSTKVLTEELNPSNRNMLYDDDRDQYDVSGGMKKKVELALEISKYCSRCFIGNGNRKNLLSKFLKGEKVIGTYVVPD